VQWSSGGFGGGGGGGWQAAAVAALFGGGAAMASLLQAAAVDRTSIFVHGTVLTAGAYGTPTGRRKWPRRLCDIDNTEYVYTGGIVYFQSPQRESISSSGRCGGGGAMIAWLWALVSGDITLNAGTQLAIVVGGMA